MLRTEAATNNVNDYGVKKAAENLPQLRYKLAAINDSYQNIQQDILGPSSTGDNYANWPSCTLWYALQTWPPDQRSPLRKIYPYAARMGYFVDQILGPELGQIVAEGNQGVVGGGTAQCFHRCQLTPSGYSVCLIFLKLFERIFAPLTAGLLRPLVGNHRL